MTEPTDSGASPDSNNDKTSDHDKPSGEDKPRGVDIARRALEEARAAAKASGKSVGQGRSIRSVRSKRSRRSWSGAGPDDRDPQTLGSLTSAVAKSRGWSGKVSEGTVFGLWPTVVGEDIAAHAEPTTLRDGVLSITAESTAWATQLRMLQSQIIAKIAAAVGTGVVTSVRITGPTAPSWRKGDRHVSGRGPRDTYG